MKNNYWFYFKQNWSNRPFQIATGIWLLLLILTLLFEKESSLILAITGVIIFAAYCFGCYLNMKEQNS